MLVSVVASALVSVLLAGQVQSASSKVTCSNHLKFAENKQGKDPCEVWAEMRDICDSSSGSDVVALASSSSTYPAPTSKTAGCDCNLEAYNSMAACSLCQGEKYKWPTVSEWKGGCGSSFDNSFIFSPAYERDSSKASEISLNLPASVSFYRPNNTWEPRSACRMSFENWDECDAKFGSITSGGGGGNGGSGGSSTSSTRPSRRPSKSGSIYDDIDYTVVWIVVAVCIALPAAMSLIALIVFCVRQKNRKKFYQPLAAYYRSGGVPPQTAWGQGGIMLAPFKQHESEAEAPLLGHQQYPGQQASYAHQPYAAHQPYDYPYKT